MISCRFCSGTSQPSRIARPIKIQSDRVNGAHGPLESPSNSVFRHSCARSMNSSRSISVSRFRDRSARFRVGLVIEILPAFVCFENVEVFRRTVCFAPRGFLRRMESLIDQRNLKPRRGVCPCLQPLPCLVVVGVVFRVDVFFNTIASRVRWP